MQRDRPKQDKGYLFSFNNSVKNSINVTPQSSNNVSFQAGFTSSLKSLSTEPYSILADSPYSELFRSYNKQNETCKKQVSKGKSHEKKLFKKVNKVQQQSSSSKRLAQLSSSKERSRPALVEKSIQNLPNFKFDIASELKSPKSVVSRKSSSKKMDGVSLKREQNIKVFVRLKPSDQEEIQTLQLMNQNTLKVEDNYFCFDRVFDESCTQQTIFENVGAQMCQQLFQGFNGTIFAYGQTGSGKTYTIFGQESLESFGLIYRCIKQILQFKRNSESKVKIKCSMVQLYKQQLIDMFGGCSDLKLKENKNQVYIQGLRQVYIDSEHEMMRLVKEGAKCRKVSSTRLNEESSRSHTILSIYLQKDQYTTKLRLIDLAGSEKVCKSGAQGEAFQQTKKINYSLSCLGNVINALTTRNKSDHIPFRDSKLTRLLKDSLTGNFSTSIIVNCSTSEQFLNQTVSSLKFAQRAKKIKVNVQSLQEEIKSKETISELHSIIRKLQYDLDATTSELQKYKQKEESGPKKSVKKKDSNPKKIIINLPLNRCQKPSKEQIQTPQEGQRCHTGESELTGRYPIPSERAYVEQNMRRYSEHCDFKPQLAQSKALLLPDFSSLNVSKSIRRLDNSPDISSLSLKYDQSPDMSLSFSIQGQSGRRQAF